MPTERAASSCFLPNCPLIGLLLRAQCNIAAVLTAKGKRNEMKHFTIGRLLGLLARLALRGRNVGHLCGFGPAYAAEFHHAREQADYLRIMEALDFGAGQQPFLFNPQGNRTPTLFSSNVGSISSTLGFVQTMLVTHTETPALQKQTIVYR